MNSMNIKDIVRQAGQWSGPSPSTDDLLNALPDELSSRWLFDILREIETKAVEPLENFRDKRLYQLEQTVDLAHAAIKHNTIALRYVAQKLQEAENLLDEAKAKELRGNS
jgi:hypothetical protein